MLVIVNFADYPYHQYRIGVPDAGSYRELLNSDAERFGGSNVVNEGAIKTIGEHAHGFDQSIEISIPPLGAAFLTLS